MMYDCPGCPRKFTNGNDLFEHHYEEHIKPNWNATKEALKQGKVCWNCGEPSHGPAWVRCPLAEPNDRR